MSSESWKRRQRKRQQRQSGNTRYPLQLADVRSRECGGCTECCTAVAVHELDKGAGVKCKHEGDGCCSIYEERPESCRTYFCLWQGGYLTDESLRPDRCGVVLDMRAAPYDESKSVIIAWERRRGAIDNEEMKKVLHELSGRVLVVVRRHGGGTRLIGTAADVRRMMAHEGLIKNALDGPAFGD